MVTIPMANGCDEFVFTGIPCNDFILRPHTTKTITDRVGRRYVLGPFYLYMGYLINLNE